MFLSLKTVEIRWNWQSKSFGLKFRLCEILDKSHVCFYVALTAPEQDNNGEAFSLTKNFKSVTIKQRKTFLNKMQSQWQLLSPPTWPSGNFHSTSPFSLRVNSTSCFKKTFHYHCVQMVRKNPPQSLSLTTLEKKKTWSKGTSGWSTVSGLACAILHVPQKGAVAMLVAEAEGQRGLTLSRRSTTFAAVPLQKKFISVVKKTVRKYVQSAGHEIKTRS